MSFSARFSITDEKDKTGNSFVDSEGRDWRAWLMYMFKARSARSRQLAYSKQAKQPYYDESTSHQVQERSLIKES
jgi:hypothetical protein